MRQTAGGGDDRTLDLQLHNIPLLVALLWKGRACRGEKTIQVALTFHDGKVESGKLKTKTDGWREEDVEEEVEGGKKESR